jgi:hypothetical protein
LLPSWKRLPGSRLPVATTTATTATEHGLWHPPMCPPSDVLWYRLLCRGFLLLWRQRLLP